MARPDKYPLVSIITVNYNQPATTIELVESLSHITYPNFEILVVDNASPDEDPFSIKTKFPGVRLIKSPINYGFAAGNNFGIMGARGRYVMLLNNDVVVTPGFLEPLVNLCERNPQIGGISPKIRFYYDPKIIQYAGFNPIDPITMRNSAIGYRQTDRGQNDATGPTAFCHGAAMLVPMDVIRKVGMMSYVFFLYYEEADWCERMKRAGYELWYTSQSLVYHKESISTGKSSPLKTYYQSRNRIVYLRRNVKGRKLIAALFYQFFVAIPKNSMMHLLRGRLRYFYAYWRAIGWNIRNFFNPEIFDNPGL